MKTVLSVLAATALYATLRYNVFKGVAWSEWPVYILNKVFALSALLLLLLHILRRRSGTDDAAPRLLSAAWICMVLHAGLSLAMLRPAYYVKYFLADKLTWQAGWSVLLGFLAAVGLYKYARDCAFTNPPPGMLFTLGVLAFVSGLHAALLGYAGWFQPATWPGHMIPITLLAFVAGSAALVAAWFKPCRLWPR